MKTINFLPWRQWRQQRCWRFWTLLFAGSLLLSLAAMTSLRSRFAIRSHALEMYLAGDRSIQHTLEAHRARWRAQHEQQQLTQQAAVLLSKTQAWQPTLVSLALALPEQAWLTQMSFQQSSLILKGYATTLLSLQKLTDSLKHFAGFTLGPAGELQQDNQGRWMYSFTLQRQE
ncbi:PilN domain-containing protein [Enterobacter sp. 638]|uniref:Fimbrial assembly family protein n=1 Tax=Enterobacter sp. (strain 638) TaxID=399742 RepID=A0A9J9GJ86_ENT38|nr:PilN domain-containing protein [Enterobacter sp. 638]ABP62462.1 Fimbrial assembly family protein [Enterobacter sp. 638]